jgi:hypothetical protein
MRSGYRCAHPECRGRTTIGPGKRSNEYEDTGKASHIFAASKRGPRGQGNLAVEELRSAVNGIWLCSEHAQQVDTNNGRDYPPPVLLSWKAAHEFRIAREHGAMLYPFGWVESLRITDAPVFKPDQRIVFTNANVIIGDNSVGKTTICDWLSSLKDSSKLRRWGAYPRLPGRTYRDVHVARRSDLGSTVLFSGGEAVRPKRSPDRRADDRLDAVLPRRFAQRAAPSRTRARPRSRSRQKSRIVRFEGGGDRSAAVRNYLARILWLQGLPDQAMRTAESSVAEARATNHAISLGGALAIAACPIVLWIGDLAAAEYHVEMLLDLLTRHALARWRALGHCYRGMLVIQRGDVDTGLRLLRAGFDEPAAVGSAPRLFTFVMAEALGRSGQIADGLAMIEEAILRFERGGPAGGSRAPASPQQADDPPAHSMVSSVPKPVIAGSFQNARTN